MVKLLSGKIIDGEVPFIQRLKALAPVLLAPLMLMLTAGCQTDDFTPLPSQQAGGATNVSEVIILRAGDVLKVSFPANANLNTTAPVRRDGIISMPLIGEVKAAGKTPKQLEAELVDLYSTQLLSKEVTVEVQSSSFPVYVTGSVLHAGRIVSDHPMTAFEAIMEAGGFDYAKASLTGVVVIRQEGDHVQKFKLDLKKVMDGKAGAPFYLKPGDTIFVPEKFIWF
jgi:polysaccharide export outer membrane protein